jgi:hypothetical protein
VNEAERAAGLPANPHYRYAQRVGARLFVAGQVPHDAQGRPVPPATLRGVARLGYVSQLVEVDATVLEE